MSDFYVTLPSSSSKSEFPDNRSNSYKIRLPNVIRLSGSGWKVGLASVALPDTNVDLTRFKSYPKPLMRCAWGMTDPADTSLYEALFATIGVSDMWHDTNIADGVSFVRALVDRFQQIQFDKLSANKTYAYKDKDGNEKRLDITFRWEGEDLIPDNAGENLSGIRSGVGFYELMAHDLGWLQQTAGGTIVLGRNLKPELYTDVKPLLHDAGGWRVTPGILTLSPAVNWRVTNLNKAFQTMVGSAARPLLVYSDVCRSGVVGNQMTDVLREIQYARKGEGSKYFEPLHIKYIDVRKEVLDIIKTQVAETTAALTQFGRGETIVTLHFKQVA